MPSRPFTWDDASAKFDQLTAGQSTASSPKRSRRLFARSTKIQVKDLTALLARVRVS
jgi:hypothetical protein